MLARLVVHLQANYGNLQTGLTQSAQKAGEWSDRLSTAAAGADLLDASATNLAFTAQTTARSLATLSQMTSVVSSGFGVLDRSTAVATAGVQTVAASAGATAPALMRASAAANGVSSGLLLVAGTARTAGRGLSLASQSAGVAARGLGVLSTYFSAVIRLVDLLAAGVGVVLVPLKLIGSIGVSAVGLLGSALWTLLLPLRIVWGLLSAAARAFWMLAKPLLAVAFAVAKVWFLLKGFIGSWKLILHWVGMLPPKLRLVVGGLLALGVAAKFGGAAMRVVGGGLRLVAGVARITAGGLQLLLLPLIAIRNPARAAAMGMTLLTSVTMTLGSVATRTAGKLISLGVSAGTMLARGIGRGALAVGKLVTGLVVLGAKAVLAAGAIGLGWGVKLANDAEQAQVAFKTMLGSGAAAKATLADLERFSAATPFNLPTVRDGAQTLLAFGFATTDLRSRLTMLGDIAAGTGKPLEDFVGVFGKVRATGRLALEQVNQLAERGVPIYEALSTTMGVSGDQLRKLISAGKVGFPELDKALQSVTSAGGMFAGGMAAQSQTIKGLFSTLKDFVGLTFQSVAETLMDAFDFKGLMARGIAFAERMRESVRSITPVIQQVAAVVQLYFGAVFDVAVSIFSGIAEAAGLSGGGILRAIVTALAMAEFYFKNLEQVGAYQFAKLELGFLGFVEGFKHFFTATLPAVLSYFSDNFGSVFLTAFDFVSTIFINLGQNIRNIMTAIWDFIASGGTAKLELAWTPLTDGFVSSLKSMKDVPARAIGPVEAALQSRVDGLGNTLKTGMQEVIQERLAALDAFGKQVDEAAEPAFSRAKNPGDESTGALAKGKAATNSATSVRSTEGQTVVTQFLRGLGQNSDQKKQTVAAVKTADGVARIARSVERGKALGTKAFA